jgi:hypothetical protein
MTSPRVLLTTLSVRTSAKGQPYLSGRFGKAAVMALEGQPDKHGNPTWNVFLGDPDPQDGPQRPAAGPPERDPAPGREMMTLGALARVLTPPCGLAGSSPPGVDPGDAILP